jgi:matrixin
MIPLALLGALAGVVGFAAIREPRVAHAPMVLGPSSTDARTTASDSANPRTLAIGDASPTTQTALNMVEPAAFIPDTRSAEIVKRMHYGAAGTYILEMLEDDSSVARWQERPTEPIRVWVDPAPSLPGWNPRFAAAARDGFTRWTAAGIPVRMNFVMDSGDAEVRVHWTSEFESSRLGVTSRRRNRNYWLVSADITVALHEKGGAALGAGAIMAIAAHEAGHALGLGHSPHDDDIMAPGYDRQPEPSGRDLMTMQLFYTIPPGRFR